MTTPTKTFWSEALAFIRGLINGTISLSTIINTTSTIMVPTHTAVNVGGNTQIIAANPNRIYLLIENDSDTDIYINLTGAAAVVNQGIRINSGGGSYEISPEHRNLVRGAITANHAAAPVNKVLLLTEGE